MDYSDLRTLHIACVHLSLAGFVLRGLLMLRESPLFDHRVTRTLPHINDTVLLAAAIGLATLSGQYPWQQSWLAMKVLCLLAYIGLGFVAFKQNRSRPLRLGAWLLAIVIFLWMISIARLHHPLGILSRN